MMINRWKSKGQLQRARHDKHGDFLSRSLSGLTTGYFLEEIFLPTR